MNEIKKIPIEGLEIHPLRTKLVPHREKDEDLVQALMEHRQLMPIITSEGMLIIGWRRLLALQSLGKTEILALEIGPITPKQAASLLKDLIK